MEWSHEEGCSEGESLRVIFRSRRSFVFPPPPHYLFFVPLCRVGFFDTWRSTVGVALAHPFRWRRGGVFFAAHTWFEPARTFFVRGRKNKRVFGRVRTYKQQSVPGISVVFLTRSFWAEKLATNTYIRAVLSCAAPCLLYNPFTTAAPFFGTNHSHSKYFVPKTGLLQTAVLKRLMLPPRFLLNMHCYTWYLVPLCGTRCTAGMYQVCM